MNIVSLGAGVQSSVMALMANEGILTPRPDCAIFADTGWEPPAIYEHLDWLEEKLDFPIYRVSGGNIRRDVENGLNTTGQKFSSIPFYTEGGGMGRRQCTREYKIDPIHRKVRELCGLEKYKKAPKGLNVYMWIGISRDEATRAKESRHKWVTHIWPLIDIGYDRRDCLKWWNERFNRKLVKSSCIGCPFRNDAMWLDMKINDPQSFEDACEFDRIIRGSGTSQEAQYLHRSRLPLKDVDFSTQENQPNLFENECEGMCGV